VRSRWARDGAADGPSAPEPGHPAVARDSPPPRHVRVAIIGAGFGGLGTRIRLRQAGLTDFVILERAASAGGTWRDNTYPGCACDVPSHLYSFSFALNPDWAHSFSRQPEIWHYLEDLTDHYGLRSHRVRWPGQGADGGRPARTGRAARAGSPAGPSLSRNRPPATTTRTAPP
jgi:putative NAD(P)-binding protein